MLASIGKQFRSHLLNLNPWWLARAYLFHLVASEPSTFNQGIRVPTFTGDPFVHVHLRYIRRIICKNNRPNSPLVPLV